MTQPHVVSILQGAVGDDSLALFFSTAHSEDLRYVAAWRRWLHWTGTHWQHDNTLSVYDRIRALCRDQIDETTLPRIADYLRRADTIAAVESLARSDRRHAATPEQWDLNPLLLGTPNGPVELDTGRLLSVRREDYITKQTAVAPDFEAGCPLWLAFLDRVTDRDRDLQQYLQRLAGYCLTGSTREQVFAFFYGMGANGKGTFVNTLTAILGDYARVASMETFTETRSDRHPVELAMLKGARLVSAQETEEGRHWAESRIKALTGGDPITARFMRQDFFTYTPQFKLIIAGNHKPNLRNVDDAMRRRLHLVPFEVHIPLEERDPLLADRLRAEYSAILAWAVHGALDWHTNGLRPPPRVCRATDDYFSAQDQFARWLSERTEPGDWSSSTELFGAWKAWATAANQYVGDARSFAENMRRRGFDEKRHPKTRRIGWIGLTLRSLR